MGKLVLLIGLALLTAIFVAPSAEATSPCGPNVQRCDPPEPCGWGGPQQCIKKLVFVVCSSVDFGTDPDPCVVLGGPG